MIPVPGHSEAVLVCLASALLVMPEPAVRRRLARVFGTPDRLRKPVVSRMIRVGAGLSVPVALVAGIGALVAAALLAGTLTVRRRRALWERRRAAEITQLLEGMEAVIGELRVGAHPSAASATAARETSGEAARAFAASAARSRLGGSGAEGLRRPGTAIAQELSRIADAWSVAERHGLALAELLAAARADLSARQRFRDRTRAALAGARATAAVLAMLPVLGIGLGQLMGAAPVRVLFLTPTGAVLLPLGTGLACAGLLWTDAIQAKVLR
ncbi:type II secretion system F family protein [Nocardia crassostreae]|uniref:type II secretion system F family protein n=1 Tax=Nocardia crassostreae TaxID=53428 RepID=UPI00082FBC6D|nr:type II secretion system F family protein [Nocardia crassostreae]